MKKIFWTASALLFLISCDSKSTNQVTMNEDGDIVISEQSYQALKEIQEEYKTCRENEESKSDCKNFTTKAIATFYQLNDEELKKDGEFINYTNLPELVEESENWELIGSAEDQGTLNKAQTAADKGIAVIAFEEGKKGGHVSMIIPGKMRKSGKWDLLCPNSTGFFRHKVESYIDKQLSYSFRSPDDVVVYKHK